MDFAEVDEFYGKDLFRKSNHPRIDNPLVLQAHWPKLDGAQNHLVGLEAPQRPSLTSGLIKSEDQLWQPSADSKELSLINYNDTFLSLYQGSFDEIGQQLAPLTNQFEHFSVISNIPYGVQSATKSRTKLPQAEIAASPTTQKTQRLFRGIGHFLGATPEKESLS